MLLDNFSLADTAEAVRRVRALPGPRVLLESSGGLTLDRAAAVAATGVDFLAVGALTHSAPALDLGLDLDLRATYAVPMLQRIDLRAGLGDLRGVLPARRRGHRRSPRQRSRR